LINNNEPEGPSFGVNYYVENMGTMKIIENLGIPKVELPRRWVLRGSISSCVNTKDRPFKYDVDLRK
jgi:hypothetical protein